MRIRVQIIIEVNQEATAPHIEEVTCFERETLSPETLGFDDTIAATFQRWYPGMGADELPQEPALAAS